MPDSELHGRRWTHTTDVFAVPDDAGACLARVDDLAKDVAKKMIRDGVDACHALALPNTGVVCRIERHGFVVRGWSVAELDRRIARLDVCATRGDDPIPKNL